jgi:hypothetical protein
VSTQPSLVAGLSLTDRYCIDEVSNLLDLNREFLATRFSDKIRLCSRSNAFQIDRSPRRLTCRRWWPTLS